VVCGAVQASKHEVTFIPTYRGRYKGEFRDDKMDGFGEMLYVTAGCRYVGNFKNNKKNGQGKYSP
jgi:hypothetical protein